MRITLVIASLQGGGAERVCVNLANAWVMRGLDVTLLTISQRSRPPAYAIDSRVKLKDIGKPRAPRPAELNHDAIAAINQSLGQACCSSLSKEMELLAMLRYGILETEPEVVVSVIDRTNVRVLTALGGSGLPVIACEQTDCSRISIGSLQSARKSLYRHAHAVVAPHQTIADWLQRQGTAAYAIPNPLVAPPAMLGPRNCRRRLVTLSRLSQEKRPELLVRAFATIAADYPDWDLEIHGDGPMRSSLANLISRVAPSRISLHEFLDAPYTILDGADLFVSTSWVEGFGNAIWEALACGVPVVAMDAGDSVRALVRHRVDGLIVKNSGSALTRGLTWLMGNDCIRAAFAMRAPEVVTRFSMESALQKWDALLESAGKYRRLSCS